MKQIEKWLVKAGLFHERPWEIHERPWRFYERPWNFQVQFADVLSKGKRHLGYSGRHTQVSVPATTDFEFIDSKPPRISGIRGYFAARWGWIAGIRAGNGHGEDGLQESALSPPQLQPVFLESGASHAELYDLKMTKKSILRDQFSWKVRNFAHTFRKGCKSFCCSISQPNWYLERDFYEQTYTSLELRTIAQSPTIDV